MLRMFYLSAFFVSATFLAALLCPTTLEAQEIADYQIETVAAGLDKPYALAFLPNGDVLVTEKANRLRIIRDGVLLPDPVPGIPEVLVHGHYNGLLDIALHPRFAENRFVYLSSTYGSKVANATRVVRATYHNGKLNNASEIFIALPMKDTLNHPGAHLAFLNDESLLITIGDGFEYREKAQDLNSLLGKVVRVTDEGKIPQTNPFLDAAGNRSPVWSYGHRHPQGIVYDSVNDIVYEHEHGPQGGDEINVIKPGKNYGWPIATHGLDYSGAYISPFKEYPGTEQPLVQWTPSPAPSGITQCRRCQWPEWEGDLLVGMLKGRHIRRVSVEDGIATQQQVLFAEIGERIRNLRFSPDGALYVITENRPGSRVLKITPTLTGKKFL